MESNTIARHTGDTYGKQRETALSLDQVKKSTTNSARADPHPANLNLGSSPCLGQGVTSRSGKSALLKIWELPWLYFLPCLKVCTFTCHVYPLTLTQLLTCLFWVWILESQRRNDVGSLDAYIFKGELAMMSLILLFCNIPFHSS